jgi:RNA polymerase sigma-70 factor (ECF subfamily)
MDFGCSPGLKSQSMNSATATTSDRDAFERLIQPYRSELHAHCYRMLGSVHDAEDALQDALLRAWRGLPRFEGRSSLRSWLYRIATNSCLRLIERRPRRVLPIDHGPPADPHGELAEPLVESVWLEPYPDAEIEDTFAATEARFDQRESIELAFAAALQHLPARQGAVLILRDVLGFSGAEVAEALDTTPTAVYSTLQRAHKTVEERLPAQSQQATMRTIGDARLSELVDSFVAAWERGDVEQIVAMLTDDATMAMPPRPSWYRGREAIGAFLAQRPLAGGRLRRLVPVQANGQLAFGAYVWDRATGRLEAHAIQLLTLAPDGRIEAISAFMGAEMIAPFGLPADPLA